jgi:hypothetical protein
MTTPSSQQASFWEVHTFVDAAIRQVGVTSWPMAGTPSWCLLADGDPRKFAALFDAAQHWILRIETCQQARAEAAKAVAASADWPQIARNVRNRAEFEAAHPWTKRGSR